MKFQVGGRNSGQTIYDAFKIMNYIKGLEDNKIYGIIKRRGIILLTKTECIPSTKIEHLIRKLEQCNLEDTERVLTYEEMRRNCKDSFYKKSYQRTIDISNASRMTRENIIEMLKEII